MNISKNCLNLIESFEGLRLDAYLDVVEVVTIGYGTTRYPDGSRVQLGDVVTEREAEGFLKLECDSVAARVERLVKVELNQNRFDALVCFCYNVGIGAFAESTLLKKLNGGDYAGAAAEFPRWNKGLIHGVKQPIKGLTRRRQAERLLFEKTGDQPPAIEIEQTPQEAATALEGYRDGDKQVVVAWHDDRVLEIVELATAVKDHLEALLGQYAAASAFRIAPAGRPIPEGPRIGFAVRGSTIAMPGAVPELKVGLLARGAEGQLVRDLQRRLADLGFLQSKVDGLFGQVTEAGVKGFQGRYFGVAEADGLVGPKTWARLWGLDNPQAPVAPVGKKAPGKHYLTLTKTDRRDEVGCFVLELAYFKDGQRKDLLEVCSGAPRKQVFRIGVASQSGSLEPLPEGAWRIGDIEWAEGKDKYDGKIWNVGLGPAKIRLEYVGPGKTSRSAIEIHIDWNRRGARGAGTAGCIGILNVADHRRLVSWLRDTDPRELFVDWGLGTCPKP
jgi:lysozyme